MTYPEIFGEYCLYLKSLLLVSREAPRPQKVRVNGQRFLNLLLLCCWKRLLRYFPVILSSSRLLFFAYYFFERQRLGTDAASAISKSRWISHCVYNEQIKRLIEICKYCKNEIKHIKSGFCMSIYPSARFISLHIVKEINVERVGFFYFLCLLKRSSPNFDSNIKQI